MIKILSLNVNGIRAAEKKGFLSWLNKESPDIICLQETRVHDPEILSDIEIDTTELIGQNNDNSVDMDDIPDNNDDCDTENAENTENIENAVNDCDHENDDENVEDDAEEVVDVIIDTSTNELDNEFEKKIEIL